MVSGIRKWLYLSLCLLLLSGCNQDFQVHTGHYSSQPVIYALFDPVDTLHTIRIERVFGAEQAPLQTVLISDSLYFEEVQVIVKLTDDKGSVKEIITQRVDGQIKDPGLFEGGSHRVYQFSEVLSWWKFPLYKSVEVVVEVPGLEPASGSSSFLPRAHVLWPYVAQQYLFLDDNRPILIQWKGDAWNEMDISFEVIEQYPDSTACQTLRFEKRTDIIMVAGVCEVKIPYELLVQDLVKNLSVKRGLVRRYFGVVQILIHTGNKDFRNWMQTMNGINDFNGASSTNIVNGLGFVACKWTTTVDSLKLDYFTRLKLASDPRLEKFGFIEF